MISKLAGWAKRITSGTSDAGDTPVDEPYVAGDFAIDEYRPLKVICIGAGFSGILTAIRFRQKVPNVNLVIYEKAAGVGGTWFANRYPGCACDVPSHNYQLPFENEPTWSGIFAGSDEIRANIERVVEKHKLMPLIRLQHELVHARWDDAGRKWAVRIRHGEDEFEDTCDLLQLCVGSIHRWRWPDIAGLHEFKGRLVHTANWDVGEGPWQEGVEDWGDKRVGVIGNGSSGIQTVAALQPKVGHITNFARSKTWIVSMFTMEKIGELLGRDPQNRSLTYTAEEQALLNDPDFFKKFRHGVETDLNALYTLTLRDSELQKTIRAALEQDMARRLEKFPDLIEKIVPKFPVFCRRLTPGEGYLEALTADNGALETTPIERVTADGVQLADGRHTPLDVLICATGFDTSYHYPFDIVGRGGRTLNERWTPHAAAYLSMAVDGFPNLFFIYGPNSGVNSGGILPTLVAQVDYAVQAARKMQRERLATVEVKAEATRDWVEHMREYFPKTVYMADCNSWYKGTDNVVVGLWPGSCLHMLRTLAHPRWEDYEYTPLDKTRNRLHWLGDGQTYNEKTMSGDRAWYLTEADVPPIPVD